MLEAREIADWNRFAPLIQTVANQFRAKDQQPVKLADVHPYFERLRTPAMPPIDMLADDLSILKRIFVDQRPEQ